MRAVLILSRGIELVGGIGTALLGLSIYVYISIKDAAVQTVDAPSYRTVVVAFLILVAPGVLMVTGSYVQILRRKLWGAVFVFIGGFLLFYLTLPTTWFLFGYTNDAWGKRGVFADSVMFVMAMAGALVNIILTPKEPK